MRVGAADLLLLPWGRVRFLGFVPGEALWNDDGFAIGTCPWFVMKGLYTCNGDVGTGAGACVAARKNARHPVRILLIRGSSLDRPWQLRIGGTESSVMFAGPKTGLSRVRSRFQMPFTMGGPSGFSP